MVNVTRGIRRTTSTERLGNRTRPDYAAVARFPGGREIVYTLSTRRKAKDRATREQSVATVQEAVGTGNGSAVANSSNVGTYTTPKQQWTGVQKNIQLQ